MDGSTWVDPRYAELVAVWRRLREERACRGPDKPCASCGHGLGAVVMVDLVSKAPLVYACVRCGS